MDKVKAKLIADNYSHLPERQEYSRILNLIEESASIGLYSYVYTGVLTSYTLTTLQQNGFSVAVGSGIVTIGWS
jgi:hypothetical protein